jgi:hypothetical protein
MKPGDLVITKYSLKNDKYPKYALVLGTSKGTGLCEVLFAHTNKRGHQWTNRLVLVDK